MCLIKKHFNHLMITFGLHICKMSVVLNLLSLLSNSYGQHDICLQIPRDVHRQMIAHQQFTFLTGHAPACTGRDAAVRKKVEKDRSHPQSHE